MTTFSYRLLEFEIQDRSDPAMRCCMWLLPPTSTSTSPKAPTLKQVRWIWEMNDEGYEISHLPSTWPLAKQDKGISTRR